MRNRLTRSRISAHLRAPLLAALVLIAAASMAPAASANGVPVTNGVFTNSGGSTITEALLGTDVGFRMTFDNTHATDPGYAPYVELLVPTGGADGAAAAADDGLVINSVSMGATTLTALTPIACTGAVINHPAFVDNTGTPITFACPADHTLYVYELPLGSFTNEQPIETVTASVHIPQEADPGTGLTMQYRGGFRLGGTPLDDPSTDPSIYEAYHLRTITPTLMSLYKDYVGPENETATGPNFHRRYTVRADVAENQVINAFSLVDNLPNGIVVVAIDTYAPGGSTLVDSPTLSTVTEAGNNRIEVGWAAITGGAGSSDASFQIEYYVPLENAAPAQILNPATGNDVTINNDVSATGSWTPVDIRDSIGPVSSDAAPIDETFTAKSIATQKSMSVVTDVAPVGKFSPGDVVQYTIVGQVSDYFAFENVDLVDVMGDGQDFDAGTDPTLSFTRDGVTDAGAMDVTNFANVVNVDGTETLTMHLSDELALAGRRNDPQLVGGCVPDGGTGAGNLPDCGVFDGGATTFSVTFRATVQDQYAVTCGGAPDCSVDEGDTISDNVTVTGDVLDVEDLAGSTDTESDGSAASDEIERGTFTKTLYAINGIAVGAGPYTVQPGDTVTFRLKQTLITSDFENMVLEDYLPLPVIDATEVGGAVTMVPNAAAPAAGAARLGPLDTFFAHSAVTPALTTDADANRVRINYGDYDSAVHAATTIDLLFTVTITDLPFADSLQLVNVGRRQQDNTFGAPTEQRAYEPFTLYEPELAISKGVIATDATGTTFTPATKGPVAFSAPGTAGYRGAGNITSNGITATPVNSNLDGIDAGDLVSFAIVVNNTGHATNGAFDVQVKDTLPAEFQVPGGGLNLTVTDGTGAAIANTNVGGGAGLFDQGIELTDPGPTGVDAGALDRYSGTSGQNILVITYDLEAKSTVKDDVAIVNTASVLTYASVEGGPTFIGDPLTDTAQVTPNLASVVTKDIIATDQAASAGDDALVGEILTYQVAFTLREGTFNALKLEDTLDTGLGAVDVLTVTTNDAVHVTTDVGGGFPGVLAAATIGSSGAGAANQDRKVTFNFGNVVNTDVDDAATETITVTYRVRVRNNSNITRGGLKNNLAVVTDSNGISNSDSANNVTIREATLLVNKTVTPTTGDAGDTLTFTIDVTHSGASNADAFDVDLTDTIPAGLTLVGASIDCSHGGFEVTITCDDNAGAGPLHVEWAAIDNQVAPLQGRVTFDVTVNGSVAPGQIITNTATVKWSSLPGDQTTEICPTVGTLCVERTGNTGGLGGAENDYTASDPAAFTANNLAVDKTMTGTSEPSSTGTTVVVGEHVTYQVQVAIPESVATSVSLTDTADPGLAIVSVDSIVADPAITTTIGGGFPGILAAPTISNVGAGAVNAGRRLVLDFGDLTNSASDGDAEYITITYTAAVVNAVEASRASTLNNAAVWAWNTTFSASDSAPDVTVAEPTLSIAKSLTPVSGDAGDTLTVTIDVTHAAASDADAFDVNLDDVLPAGFTYVAASLDCIHATYATPDTCSEAGGTISAVWNAMDSSVAPTRGRLVFDVTVDPTLDPATIVTNTASLDWSSLPGDETANDCPVNTLCAERTGSAGDTGGAQNDYSTSDPATFTQNSPSAAKSVISTDQAHTTPPAVVVGEKIQYETTLTIPEGTLAAVTLDDTLDEGLAFESVDSITPTGAVTTSVGGGFAAVIAAASITNAGGGYNEARKLSLNLGTLTNADSDAGAESLAVRYTVVVVNASATARGSSHNNSAVWAYTGGSSTASAANVMVTEPTLQIAKTMLPATGDAGDPITVTLTVSHTAASDADAQNVTVSDVLPANMSYVGALDCNGAGATVSATCTEAGGTITATYTSIPTAGTNTAVITFTAAATGSAVMGSTLTNSADVSWTSVAGARIVSTCASATRCVERTGSIANPGGAENDYLASASDTFDMTGSVAAAKSIVSTDLASTTTTDVAVGERIQYQTTLSVPEGTTENVQLVDSLDEGLAFVSVDSITGSAGLSTSVGGGFAGAAAAATISDAAGLSPEAEDRVLTIGLGDIANTNTVNATIERITVLYTVAVVNLPSVNRSTTHNNSADWTTDIGNSSASAANVTIVEPTLQIAKTVVPAGTDAGATVDVTITVSHDASSDGAGHDVTVSDVLPAGMTYLGSLACNTQSASTTCSHAAGTITATYATIPRTGTNTAVITFQATLANTLNVGDIVTNTADTTWTSYLGDRTTNACPSPAALCVERTGSALDPGAAANDYADSASDTASINASSIAGFAYNDTDNDGVYEPGAGETPLVGVLISLSGDDHLGNPVIDSMATLADGSYSFTLLRPSDGTGYTLTEGAVGGGLMDGTDTVGSEGGTSPVNDALRVVLATATDATDYNFGEIEPADISGRVWEDTDDNGTQNGIEPGIDLVDITLTGIDDLGSAVNVTVQTNATGDYTFTNVRPSNGAGYTLTQTQPAGYYDGQDELGTLAGVPVNGGTGANDSVGTIPVVPGDSGSGYNFGELIRVDVSAVKTIDLAQVGINDPATYTLTIHNSGPSEATNVVVGDDLPETDVSLVSINPGAGALCPPPAADLNITCTIASLPAGQTITIEVNVTILVEGAITNTVTTTRDQVDLDAANDDDTLVVSSGPSDIEVTKSVVASGDLVGSQLTYTIIVRNHGPGFEQDVVLTDPLPAHALLTASSTTRGTCAGTTTIVCALGDLQDDELATITIVVVAPEAGNYVNAANVPVRSNESDATNNEDTVTSSIRDPEAGDCTVDGTPASEPLTGTSGNDIICGGSGDDTITCSDGHDTIVSGSGNDTITCSGTCPTAASVILTGTGDDTINVDCPGIIIDGGDGNDKITLKGDGTVSGGGGNDTITAVGNGSNILCGNGGNDTIQAGGGNDTVSGGTGTDRLFGQNGNDLMYGDAGNDRVVGGNGIDELYGGAGNDTLDGSAGRDVIFGERGKDAITGGAGTDRADGGAGADRFQMKDRTADRISGGAGRDTLRRDGIDAYTKVERLT